MDVMRLTVLFLGLKSTLSQRVQINQPEKKQIVNAINRARKNLAVPGIGVDAVIWDYPLETSLKAFHETHGGAWFYEDGCAPYNTMDFNVQWKMFCAMKQPEFFAFDLKNYNYIFHDTCNNKAGDVLNIFKYRINQKPCFKYSNCKSYSFSNFISCNSMPIPRESGHPCSWAWRYYTQLIRDELKTIACIRLGIAGPFTPSNQKDAFVCYGESKVPLNDVPYLRNI